MQKIERLNLLLGFEDWAATQNLDLEKVDHESTYSDPQTACAWLAYLEAHQQRNAIPPEQRLYAEIRESSKYANQIDMCRKHPCGHPFRVRIEKDSCGYVVKGGVGGQYRLTDVVLYMSNSSGKTRLT